MTSSASASPRSLTLSFTACLTRPTCWEPRSPPSCWRANWNVAAVSRSTVCLLLNDGMIVQRASLTRAQTVLRSPIGPLLARFSTRRVFVSQFERPFSQAHQLDPAEAEDQWALWRHAGDSRIAHRLINYIDQRVAHAQGWHHSLSDWPGDLRFAWGMRDPVATPDVLAGLRELRPAAPVTELADLGHYAQIEQPAAIAGEIVALASGVRRTEAGGGRGDR